MIKQKQSRAKHRLAKHQPSRRKAPPAPPAVDLFPIIGIGTSAGGLEALEHFLSHVPKNSGALSLSQMVPMKNSVGN